MFEIKKIEHINKTFRLPANLVKELTVLAQKHNVSLNNLVVQCCEYALSSQALPHKKSSQEGNVL